MAHELKNLYLYRIHDGKLQTLLEKYAHGRLVDIGCGTKPYQDLVKKYVDEHIGVDHEDCLHNQSNVDLFGTAYEIPIENDSFDTAISTAVLEHLEEPQAALNECFRVLKPGAHAIYSVPFIWHVHEEPRDFYRYSRFGLQYLFEKAGFEIVSIDALSGFWFTFGQLLTYNLYRLNRGPLRWLRIIDVLGLILMTIFYGLDRIDKTEKWTWMYMVVAKKPETNTSS